MRVKSTAFIKASLRLFESSLSPFSFFVEEDQLANSKSTKMDEAWNIFCCHQIEHNNINAAAAALKVTE